MELPSPAVVQPPIRKVLFGTKLLFFQRFSDAAGKVVACRTSNQRAPGIFRRGLGAYLRDCLFLLQRHHLDGFSVPKARHRIPLRINGELACGR